MTWRLVGIYLAILAIIWQLTQTTQKENNKVA